jgi:acyl carrier protein
MPLTPNGKINRLALPQPDVGPAADRTIVAARNVTEQILVGIWSKILGQSPEQISIEDHFFSDLGGHSLLATQLVSRVRTALKVELSLRRFFESPTIEALAREVDCMRSTAGAITPEIQRLDREPSR